MSRVRTYLVGRDAGCDFRVDETSVANRHAEVVLLDDGSYFVTDRGSETGTFVWRDGQWLSIQQDFVAAGEMLSFGHCQMLVDELDILRAPSDGRAGVGAVPGKRRGYSPNPDKGLERDPLTGEILERSDT